MIYPGTTTGLATEA